MNQVPRDLVEEAIRRIVGGEHADRVLDRVLHANRGLSREDRARVARWTLGLSLWRGRIDALAGGRRELWLGLFLADREGVPIDEAAALTGIDADSLRQSLEHPPCPSNPAERLAFSRSLPPWLAERWIARLGVEGADRLAAAMNRPGPVCVRANLLRNTRDELARILADEGVASRPSSLSPTALRLDGRPNIFGLPSWRQGRFEVQDEASQWVADAVRAGPGETVIDLCAGSGGKTLALAAAMSDRGCIVALDANAARLRDMRARLRRAGVACAEVRQADATDPDATRDLNGLADAVLVDAPCSELGVLRRSPDARWRTAADAPVRFSSLQTALLEAGARLVAPGGRLVYATCSTEPEETTEVVTRLRAPGFAAPDCTEVGPDREGCDGFFRAVWREAIAGSRTSKVESRKPAVAPATSPASGT